MSTLDSDPIVDLGTFNLADALATLKANRHWHYVNDHKGCRNRRAKSFFACCDVPLPIVGEDGTYFPGMANVEVSYDGAVKFVTDLLKNFTNRGAGIRIRASGHCVFIGGH